MQEINIRKGTRDDLKDTLLLVKELAKYEKEPDSVLLQLSDYQKAYAENLFDFLVAEQNEKILGTAIYYPVFSTWKGKSMYLEDLIVTEDHRNEGIGQALFDAFKSIAMEQQAAQVKWQVLDWNQHAIRFYLRNKAKIDKEWYNGVIVF
jgi:N-acetylglutamate synthase-like GNAT family acetyltransferase